jgi:hypothetical protein
MEVYYNKSYSICLLSKVILENFVVTLQMGSDTIVMVGPQRLARWGDL